MSTQNETEYISSTHANSIGQGLGETKNALRYRSIIDAVRLIDQTKRQLNDEEGLGPIPSPAWRLLSNAEEYLLKQANVVLRGGGM
jgi:hypothetical protein